MLTLADLAAAGLGWRRNDRITSLIFSMRNSNFMTNS
jgi:hypothetical protein